MDLGKTQPKKRVVVVLVALACGLVATAWTQNIIIGAVGAVTVIASTIELFIPCKFRLDEKGAHSQIGLSSYTLPWPDVKRELVDEEGIRLSPLEKPSRLDAFRGVYLRTPCNQEEVLVKIRELRESYGRVDS